MFGSCRATNEADTRARIARRHFLDRIKRRASRRADVSLRLVKATFVALLPLKPDQLVTTVAANSYGSGCRLATAALDTAIRGAID